MRKVGYYESNRGLLMMIGKSVTLALCLLGLSFFAHKSNAGLFGKDKPKFCASNLAEFQKLRNNLPAVFQNVDKQPLMFATASDSMVTAAVEFYFDDKGEIKLKGAVCKTILGSVSCDDDKDEVAQSLCYVEGGAYEVKFQNGSSYSGNVKDNVITISNFDFTKTSSVQYANRVQKVKSMREASSGHSSSSATQEQGAQK
jgi:hypothetical protein